MSLNMWEAPEVLTSGSINFQQKSCLMAACITLKEQLFIPLNIRLALINSTIL